MCGGGNQKQLILALTQRGLSISRREPKEKTLYGKLSSPEIEADFDEKFSSYSFRIFLRDVVSIRDNIRPDDFGLFVDRERVEEYLAVSREMGILMERGDGAYTFPHNDITDIGDTFEYYTCKVLAGMGFTAMWGVKFDSIESGGDFDLVGLAGNSLFYVETKTSPPKHIEKNEMVSFLDRIRSLKPDLAIFLNDTHLRMKDKLVPLLEESITDMRGENCTMKRIEREIFTIAGKIFVANTKRDIGLNLRTCFNEFFTERWKREMPFLT